jgi:TctA family transporter
VPFYTLVPPILVFVFIGAFAANFSSYDLVALLLFSLLGFSMRRYGWPRAPLVLGLVLGRKMELYLWLSVARYQWEWLLRPGVMALLLLVAASFAFPLWKERWEKRKRLALG